MVGIVKSVDYYSPYLVEWDSHLIYGFNIINLTDQIPPDFFWYGAIHKQRGQIFEIFNLFPHVLYKKMVVWQIPMYLSLKCPRSLWMPLFNIFP